MLSQVGLCTWLLFLTQKALTPRSPCSVLPHLPSRLFKHPLSVRPMRPPLFKTGHNPFPPLAAPNIPHPVPFSLSSSHSPMPCCSLRLHLSPRPHKMSAPQGQGCLPVLFTSVAQVFQQRLVQCNKREPTNDRAKWEDPGWVPGCGQASMCAVTGAHADEQYTTACHLPGTASTQCPPELSAHQHPLRSTLGLFHPHLTDRNRKTKRLSN